MSRIFAKSILALTLISMIILYLPHGFLMPLNTPYRSPIFPVSALQHLSVAITSSFIMASRLPSLLFVILVCARNGTLISLLPEIADSICGIQPLQNHSGCRVYLLCLHKGSRDLGKYQKYLENTTPCKYHIDSSLPQIYADDLLC